MSESGFWWSHWGHLLTKPLESFGLFALCALRPEWLPVSLPALSPWMAVAVALVVPMVYSLWRKQRLWPGCLVSQTAEVVADEVVDTWTAAIGVVPLVVSWPLNLILVLVGLVVLIPGGFHKGALP